MNSQDMRKRIVFIIGSMGKGGAERVVSILANNYADKGWNVDIITLLDDIVDYELNTHIRIIPMFSSKSRLQQLPHWILGIRRYIKINQPDIIVSFFARINIISLLSCFGLKKHIFISERSDPKADGRSIMLQIATYILYPLANGIIFQTKWAKSCFPKNIQKKSMVIGNPIHITMEASEYKNKKIVSVGRLIEVKNHAMLINAFKRVYDQYPEYKLYIYGEGRLKDKLNKQIEDLGLINNVILPGNVTDVQKNISDAEIFVLTSRHEGLPNALLEAMMMGLACITTNFSSVYEIITNNDNGIIVDVNDEEQLSKAICELIINKEKINLIGRKGKESVQNMKEVNIIEQWQEYMDKTLFEK